METIAQTEPTWTRTPVEPREEASANYRGFLLSANTYAWHVSGRWQGYSVMASDQHYGSDRPSVDENMAAAIAAADDLAEKGWEPR